ncbi:YhcH/YjgK/YiaL family protein [Halodesulfovibrio sp.]|jgi:YhcH/YjgK/YiaL family protein|uniref:YhcH/YjgK/YiaL family protein n=1 Tax=Halodesulfovibrio sp. TaxID=1912772 RepID=UPI0025E5A5A8|nr:YhcH/YjgK/YiaL family protein [Halodesulfovibrio sp.]MCT4535584.1 YhcH/YjgK/YiaL family protein [Halodesulfovibrio sp.]
MILDVLDHAAQYESLSPFFAKAFSFLNREDLRELADGQYAIEGKKLFATVVRDKGRAAAGAKLEAHDDYIDIHFVLRGTERMGWKSRRLVTAGAEKPNEGQDLYFYDEEPASWATVESGAFAVFFPEDAHLPMVADGDIHKVILKVAVVA